MPYDLTALRRRLKFDPVTPSNPDNWYAQTWLYDSLMRQDADGTYSPGLAKSATATDPQTIVIELPAQREVLRRHPGGRGGGEVQHRAEDHRGNVGSVRAELQQVQRSPSTAPRSSRSS